MRASYFPTLMLSVLIALLSDVAHASNSIQESVNELRKGQTIPRSLIDRSDSKVLAAALVKRKSFGDLNAPTDPTKISFDFAKRTQIVIAFPFQYFASIRRDGFLNQFQVPHSANMDRKHRLVVEDRMLEWRIPRDSNPTSRVNYLRPKYAYLNLDIPTGDPSLERVAGFPTLQIEGRYGNVFASLKASVKARSTFTAGDSLFNLGAKTGDARTLLATQTTPEKADHYFEAQIWGALDLNDVEFFLVNCEGPDFGAPLTQENIETIKSSGLPVYKCVPRSRYKNSSAFAHYLDRGARL